MVLNNRPSVKKFNCKELKALIRKYNLGKVGGRKSELISRITSSNQWDTIKANESLPVREKRVFSEAQLKAQQSFRDRVSKNKSIDKVSKIETEIVRDEKVEDIIKISKRLVKKPNKETKKIDNLSISLNPLNTIDKSIDRRKLELNDIKNEIHELRSVIIGLIL